MPLRPWMRLSTFPAMDPVLSESPPWFDGEQDAVCEIPEDEPGHSKGDLLWMGSLTGLVRGWQIGGPRQSPRFSTRDPVLSARAPARGRKRGTVGASRRGALAAFSERGEAT